MAFLTLPDSFPIAHTWIRSDLPEARDIAGRLAGIPAGLSARGVQPFPPGEQPFPSGVQPFPSGVPALSLGCATALANLAPAFSPRVFGTVAVRTVHKAPFRTFFLNRESCITDALDAVPASPGLSHPFFQGDRDVLACGTGYMGGRGSGSQSSMEEDRLPVRERLPRLMRSRRTQNAVTNGMLYGFRRRRFLGGFRRGRYLSGKRGS